ncbi:MAG: hypothetical protein RhofKO_25870 [Rhodothermales bacterium]
MPIWNHTCHAERQAPASQSDTGAVTRGDYATLYQGACSYQSLSLRVQHDLKQAGVTADGALWLPKGYLLTNDDRVTIDGVGVGRIVKEEPLHGKYIIKLPSD